MNKPIIAVATIALSLILSFPLMSITEQQTAVGQELQEKTDVPLNFTLRTKGGGAEESNASSMKEITVTLKVKTSAEGNPMDIPLTAKVSNDTKPQDVEVCGAMQGVGEMCHTLEQITKPTGENQSSGTSNQSSGSDNSTTNNNDEDNDEDN